MIPTYRPKEIFLRQTLESVFQQDPRADEMQIEVVDDCSPGLAVATKLPCFWLKNNFADGVLRKNFHTPSRKSFGIFLGR